MNDTPSNPAPSTPIRRAWGAVALVFALAGALLIAGSPPPNDVSLPSGVLARVVNLDVASNKLIVQVANEGQPVLTVPTDIAATVVRSLDAGDQVWMARKDVTAVTAIVAKQELKPEMTGAIEARVAQVDSAHNKLTVNVSGSDQPLVVPPPLAVAIVKTVAAGDDVWITKQDTSTVTAVAPRMTRIGWTRGVGALCLTFAVVWFGILLVTCCHPWAFALGVDFRLSNSQTQIYLWFITFATVFLAELTLRCIYTGYFGGIGAPAKLIALSGISALSFGAARASATFKDAPANAAAAAAGITPPKGIPNATRTRWHVLLDLFTSDSVDRPNGRYSVGDFQMIVLTFVAIAAYLIGSAAVLTELVAVSHVDLPPVDETLLGGTAVSQGAYLFKKFASPSGH